MARAACSLPPRAAAISTAASTKVSWLLARERVTVCPEASRRVA